MIRLYLLRRLARRGKPETGLQRPYRRVYLRRAEAQKRQHVLIDSDLRMSSERRTIPVMRQSSARAQDCPLAPPEHASVRSRTLHRACLILGGVVQLAKHLGVPESDLRRWMTGDPGLPHEVFLRAVEVLILYVSGKGQSS
jgi:hypothetical protein